MNLDLTSELEKENKRKKYEYIKEWRKKNPEKYKIIKKRAQIKDRIKNRERYAKKSLDYYYEHREEILKRKKEKYRLRKENKDVSIP